MSSLSTFSGILFSLPFLYTGDMSVGRQEAFNIFRRDYSQNTTIEDNKLLLKQRYGEAKILGQTVNENRQNISECFNHDVSDAALVHQFVIHVVLQNMSFHSIRVISQISLFF